MLVLIDRRNLILAILVFMLSSALFALNVGNEERVAAVSEVGSKTTVVIDPGHGGEDPGAVSDYSGTSEKNINLNIGLKVKSILEEAGYLVIMTRTEDRLEYPDGTPGYTAKRHQDLLKRKKLMDESGAGAIVSIHLNKFGQTQYHGAQVFFPKAPAESRALAVSIQQSLKEFVEPGNSREALIKRDPLIILKNAKYPTVIVECGFLSNSNEEKKLINKEYQDKLAEGISKGIVAFLTENQK